MWASRCVILLRKHKYIFYGLINQLLHNCSRSIWNTWYSCSYAEGKCFSEKGCNMTPFSCKGFDLLVWRHIMWTDTLFYIYSWNRREYSILSQGQTQASKPDKWRSSNFLLHTVWSVWAVIVIHVLCVSLWIVPFGNIIMVYIFPTEPYHFQVILQSDPICLDSIFFQVLWWCVRTSLYWGAVYKEQQIHSSIGRVLVTTLPYSQKSDDGGSWSFGSMFRTWWALTVELWGCLALCLILFLIRSFINGMCLSFCLYLFILQ